jgi:peptide/nickel transport system substrate-binding protein
MQQRLYELGVVVIFGYPDMLEAYRTDVIEEGSPLTQPAENGNMYGQDGYWSWWSAQPAGSGDGDGGQTGGGGGADEEGSSTGLALGMGIGVLVVLLVGGILLARRRSATAGERE